MWFLLELNGQGCRAARCGTAVSDTPTGPCTYLRSFRPNAARSAVADSIWGPWKELGNPCIGDNADKTFFSQSTYILPVHGKKDAFIYIGDRWNPDNAIDGRYIWLPVILRDNRFEIRWLDRWNLSWFDKNQEQPQPTKN